MCIEKTEKMRYIICNQLIVLQFTSEFRGMQAGCKYPEGFAAHRMLLEPVSPREFFLNFLDNDEKLFYNNVQIKFSTYWWEIDLFA